MPLAMAEMSPEQRVDHIFKLMDKNKDGRISLQEFVTVAHTDQLIGKLLK